VRIRQVLLLTIVAFGALYVGMIPLMFIMLQFPMEARPPLTIFLEELPIQILRAGLFAVLYTIFAPPRHPPSKGAILGLLVGLLMLSIYTARLVSLMNLVDAHPMLLVVYSINVGAWTLAGFLLALVSRRLFRNQNAAV